MALGLSVWWMFGWAIGALVVVVAASLILLIIALARKIISQAEEITTAIDGARVNTNALFDLTKTNLALEQITRGLNNARGGGRVP
ncbi:MAG: hypothetical protein M3133_09840 [Actinomycetota bacterium]|nr:hypothetical protein [Actinomycetota bacterium]